MTNHTPTPWIISEHVDNLEIVARAANGDIIANFEVDSVHLGEDVILANAQIMTSAPELLSLLREILDVCPCAEGWDSPYYNAVNAARNFISKEMPA